MKGRILKLSSLIIVVFLIIAAAACSTDDSTLEYGSPYAYFRVYGYVLDDLNSEAIEGIKVTFVNSTVYTNENGEYIIESKNSIKDQIYTIKFIDADAELNGLYLQTDSTLDFTELDYIGGDGSWNYGDKSLRLDIKLTQSTL